MGERRTSETRIANSDLPTVQYHTAMLQCLKAAWKIIYIEWQCWQPFVDKLFYSSQLL